MKGASRSLALIVLMLAAACAGTEPTTTTPTTSTTTTSTTTTSATTTSTTTTSTTTTFTTTTTQPEPEEAANFEITRVDFRGDGFVEVTNTGSAPGAAEGLWLCQFPFYSPLPEVPLEPGESVWVTRGDGQGLAGDAEPVLVVPEAAYGEVIAESGEMGLYVATGFSVNFSSPAAIISYVEWGDGGHARSNVAMAAGIWREGGFVDVAGADMISTTVAEPTDPSDWQAG